MIMAVSMVISLVVVVFIIVVFVWLSLYGCLCYCALPRLNVHNIPPYRTTAAEAFISSSAVVQEGSPKDQ